MNRRAKKKGVNPLLTIRSILNVLDIKFIRFAIIGAFCTLLNVVTLYLLTGVGKVNYMISSIITLVIINFIGFYLNKYYTFKTEKKRFFKELYKYYSVMFSSFILNLFFMFVLVQIFNVWYIYASLTITVGFMFYNFLMHKNWSFK